MNDRIFGDVPGMEIGSRFPDRKSLAKAGIHRPLQAGISGGAADGADSIILSGGYEDDLDEGDVIIYTGHGGNDPSTKKQIADQSLTRQNLALAKSHLEGLPVRVVRGHRHSSPYSPESGYRYDGLYQVESYWSDRGQSGYLVWRFRLVRDAADPVTESSKSSIDTLPVAGDQETRRIASTVQRMVRNTQVAQWVKAHYEYRCQVCGIRLETSAGPYSEAAHIRPLGQPHNGPDTVTNILCLCPNHHVLFDHGAFVVTDDWACVNPKNREGIGRLQVRHGHEIGHEYLSYHRQLFEWDMS